MAQTVLQPRVLPSYVPSSVLGAYERTRGLYNYKLGNTRRHRASLGKAMGGTGLAHHAYIANSTGSAYDGITMQQLASPARTYLQTMASLGVPSGGPGLVFAADAALPTDPRWTFTGTWGNANQYRSNTVSGSKGIYTPAAGDAPFRYFRFNTFGSSGGYTYSGDSGAFTGTITPTGGSTSYGTIIDCGTVGQHTIEFTASTNNSYLIGGCGYGTSGLLVHNLSLFGTKASGSGSAGWTDTSSFVNTNNARTGALPATPDSVFCKLGVNDGPVSTTPIATITAALTTLRNQFASSDFFLIAEYQPSGQTNWDAWVGALYGLADTLDVPLFDLYARSGGYTAAAAAGFMGDGTHPNLAGMKDEGRSLALAVAI